MGRWIRLAAAYFKGRFDKKKCQFTDEFSSKMRVWPTDADFRIVNNSVYMVYLECARLEMLVRTGLLMACRENKVVPVIKSGSIQYLRPLKRGDEFVVRSRVIGCTSRYFYVTHELSRDGVVCVSALAIVCFVGKDGLRATSQILKDIGSTSLLSDNHEIIQCSLAFEATQRKGKIA